MIRRLKRRGTYCFKAWSPIDTIAKFECMLFDPCVIFLFEVESQLRLYDNDLRGLDCLDWDGQVQARRHTELPHGRPATVIIAMCIPYIPIDNKHVSFNSPTG